MTIKLRWDDDAHSIMRVDLESRWTWGEMRKARKIIFDMMDESPAPRVYTMIYFVDGKINLPDGGMGNMNSLTQDSHPKAGLTIVVGVSGWMKTLLGTYAGTVRRTGRPVEFEYADTLAEARQMIAREQRVRG